MSALSVFLFSANAARADCPQLYAECVVLRNGICNIQGTTHVDSCWSWTALECEPCARANQECNTAFPSCNGNCTALSTDESGAICRPTAIKDKNLTDAFEANNGKYIRLRADEALMGKRHQRELSEKLDDGAQKHLIQRQTCEKQLMQKMQSEALGAKE